MRSTGDIQFFVCRSRIIPEPPFPSQGIAGSGNEIGHLVLRRLRVAACPFHCYHPAVICKLLTNSSLSQARLVSLEVNLCLLFLPRRMGLGRILLTTYSSVLALEGLCHLSLCRKVLHVVSRPHISSSLLSSSDHAHERQSQRLWPWEKAKFWR